MAFRASPIRSFTRSATRLLSEPHPYGRYPTTTPSHAPDYKRLGTQLWRTATWYIPVSATILCWPLATAWALKKTGI
ncbi:hypothetical protein K490DRAFT_61733 [Saccharata proteae CBS 121410]|uniref:Uncharacterized protein n=1 Tax=Saccharata proteae CBS 121410 TaxID=1314787 RepID=A0A9P4M2H0_9PEZI|nr:hypothetical protein K490DRAFT_61733 [Saccharata proteae CBS 121410]